MKKLTALLATMAIMMTIAASSFAIAGGMPAAHGVCGKTFGSLVSEMAHTYPGAVAEHVAGCVD